MSEWLCHQLHTAIQNQCRTSSEQRSSSLAQINQHDELDRADGQFVVSLLRSQSTFTGVAHQDTSATSPLATRSMIAYLADKGTSSTSGISLPNKHH